ncbi:DUF4142 domain-containing protein [Mesorhizobium sp. M1088]|uniref:DUF4142 domain-containing protein n=1 Tax=Mesorhizobium sp. M1088 TaxID=2957056 RepID=UPI003336AE75
MAGPETSGSSETGERSPRKLRALSDQLKEASGDSFQSKYIDMQTQALALFSAYANSGDHPATKEFAKKTLPVLQMHERHVKDLAAAHQWRRPPAASPTETSGMKGAAVVRPREQSTESAAIHLAYSREDPTGGGIRKAPRAVELGFGTVPIAAVTG